MDEGLLHQNISLLESGEILTEREKNVFALVTEICSEFDPPIIARAAGGWVRDKLLGKESDDLDIAVENTTGLTFAMHLKNHETESRLIVIEANPDQSKHLETARVCLFSDYWIDFCGLRSDSYAADSRIPEIKQGTPLEDALRRDFTINAIFFNINTRKIEDYTNGLTDLVSGVLRTPMDPLISFRDDPLRILRAIRFASRFDFKLDDSIIPAAREVKEDFSKKITKERITAEVTKSFSGDHQSFVIHYIYDCEIFQKVFDPANEWNLNPEEAVKRCDILLSRNIHFHQVALLLAAIFQPLIDHENVCDYEGKKRKIPAVEFAITRQMRVSSKIANDAYHVLEGAKTLSALRNNLNRLQVGRWIKNIGEMYQFAHYLVFDEEIYNFCNNELIPYIQAENLGDCLTTKPLLNGVELANIHGIKPGRQLREYVANLFDWQLEHPTGTVDDYIMYVNSK